MFHFGLPRQVLLLVACAAAPAMATSPAIGMAVSNGTLQVDSARMWGNATIFEGNVIETAKAASDVKLTNGVQMRLASETRARVYSNRVVLEKGYEESSSLYFFPLPFHHFSLK